MPPPKGVAFAGAILSPWAIMATIMSKRQVLMLIGVAVAAFLFVGIPSSWDAPIALALGILTVFVAYSLAPERDPRAGRPVPYVEYKAAFKAPVRSTSASRTTPPAPPVSSVPEVPAEPLQTLPDTAQIDTEQVPMVDASINSAKEEDR